MSFTPTATRDRSFLDNFLDTVKHLNSQPFKGRLSNNARTKPEKLCQVKIQYIYLFFQYRFQIVDESPRFRTPEISGFYEVKKGGFGRHFTNLAEIGESLSDDIAEFLIRSKKISNLVRFKIQLMGTNRRKEVITSRSVNLGHQPFSQKTLNDYIEKLTGFSTIYESTPKLPDPDVRGLLCLDCSKQVLNKLPKDCSMLQKVQAVKSYQIILQNIFPSQSPAVHLKIACQFIELAQTNLQGICLGLSYAIILFLLVSKKDTVIKSSQLLMNEFVDSEFYELALFLHISQYYNIAKSTIDFQNQKLLKIPDMASRLFETKSSYALFIDAFIFDNWPQLEIVNPQYRLLYKKDYSQLSNEERGVYESFFSGDHSGMEIAKILSCVFKSQSQPSGVILSAVGHAVAVFCDHSTKTYLFFDSNTGVYKMNDLNEVAFWFDLTFENPESWSYTVITRKDEPTMGGSSSNAASGE